ncbi:hypothetical protein V5799_008317, partial [Amblyomma americanum]
SDSGSSPLASSSHVRRSPCSPSSAATLSEGSFPSSRRSSETHLASPSFSSQRPKAKERATKVSAILCGSCLCYCGREKKENTD